MTGLLFWDGGFANDADLMVSGYPTGMFERVIGFSLITKGAMMPTTTSAEPESRPAELITV